MTFPDLKERIRPWYLRGFYFRVFPSRKPDYFDSCWRYPSAPLGHKQLPEDWSGIPGIQPDVLFFPMGDWHSRLQRTQHLARTLAKRGHRCFYLNPHLGREFPGMRGPAAFLTRLEPRVFEIHVRLPLEPVFHHRLLKRSEATRISEVISSVADAFGSQRLVQLVAFPVWFDIALDLRTKRKFPVVYDCHDYLPGFEGIAGDILETEERVFRESDLTICSSDALVARAREHAVPDDRLLLLRNAAAVEDFAGIARPIGPRHPTVIGYVGALDSWFDIESVATAAGRHADWRIELIGRIENLAVENLRSFSNVHFVGEVPYQDLPKYLSAFSLAVIPFLNDALTRATDPIKAYEYLAAGLPVLSARLPELYRLRDVISFYDNPDDFIRQAESLLATDSPALAQRRTEVARGETWSARCEVLAPHLARLIAAG